MEKIKRPRTRKDIEADPRVDSHYGVWKEGEDGWWCYLYEGWVCHATDTGTCHEDTVAELCEALHDSYWDEEAANRLASEMGPERLEAHNERVAHWKKIGII